MKKYIQKYYKQTTKVKRLFRLKQIGGHENKEMN